MCDAGVLEGADISWTRHQACSSGRTRITLDTRQSTPAPDGPYGAPVGGIYPRFNNLDGSSPADLCSGVGQILTIMALTASMQAHRPATLTLLKPQGTIQQVVAAGGGAVWIRAADSSGVKHCPGGCQDAPSGGVDQLLCSDRPRLFRRLVTQRG